MCFFSGNCLSKHSFSSHVSEQARGQDERSVLPGPFWLWNTLFSIFWVQLQRYFCDRSHFHISCIFCVLFSLFYGNSFSKPVYQCGETQFGETLVPYFSLLVPSAIFVEITCFRTVIFRFVSFQSKNLLSGTADIFHVAERSLYFAFSRIFKRFLSGVTNDVPCMYEVFSCYHFQELIRIFFVFQLGQFLFFHLLI